MGKVGRGRPRKFDTETLLSQAVMVFWEKGFAGTSIEDLVEATGVGAQSLYHAFGDKRGLFIEVLKYYSNNVAQAVIDRLNEEGSPYENIRSIFLKHQELAGSDDPFGCLIVNTSSHFRKNDDLEISAILESQSVKLSTALAKTILRGQTEKEIDQTIDPHVSARILVTIINGIMVGIRSGMPNEFLNDIISGIDQLLLPKSGN